MIPERYQRLDVLFRAAVVVPEDERGPWIAAHCEPELRGELEALLAHDREPRASLEDSPALLLAEQVECLEPVDTTREAPPELEGYRFVCPLGAGGMGVVWEAEQRHPPRAVAIKVLRSGRSSSALLRRFATEVRALARMDHPGIARIHDAGVAEVRGEPRPYLVMELVRGEPMLAWAERMRLGLRARCELFARVTEAVQGAHAKGVIHRDLKAANVLVDRAGQVKILDFGVARLLGGENAGALGTRATNTGQLVGSLDTMSPEQASGRPDAIDVRTDVYSLGCLLFQLLTNRPPFEFEDVPLPEAVRRIHDEDPPRLASLDRRLAGDLDTITAKALAKAPRERYGSASELAADVRRFLEEQPIQARPATTLYQLRKFARRNRAQAVGAAIALAALVVAFVAVLVFARSEHRERERAERTAAELRRKLLVESLASIRDVLEGADPSGAREQLQRLPTEERGWERAWLEARAAGTLTTDVQLGSLVPALARVGPEHVLAGTRGAELHRIRTTTGEVEASTRLAGPVGALAVSADGAFLAALTSSPCELSLRQGERIVRVESFESSGSSGCVALAAHASWAAFGLPDGRLVLWDLPDGATRFELELGGEPRALRVDPWRGWLAFARAGASPELGFVDPASGEILARFAARGFQPAQLCVPGPGMLAAIGGAELRVWRAPEDSAPIALTGEADWTVLEPVPGTKLLIVGDAEGRLIELDCESGRVRQRARGRYGRLSAILPLPAEGLVAVGYQSGRIEFLELASERSLLSLAPLGSAPVHALLEAPERDALAVAQGTVLRLIPLPKAAFRELRHESFVYEAVALAAHGLWATTGWDGCIRLWDERDGGVRGAIELGDTGIGLCADGPGETLFVTTKDWRVRCYALGAADGARTEATLRWSVDSCHAEPAGVSMTVSPSGRLVLRVCDRDVVALRTLDGTLEGAASFSRAVTDLVLHPLTQELGVLTQSGFYVLDPETLVVRREVELEEFGTALGADPEGGWVIGCRSGRLFRLARSDQAPRLLGEVGAQVMALALAPDGERLAVGTRNGRVCLWDSRQWYPLIELDPHQPGTREASYFYVHDLDWSADGSCLVSSSGDGTARLWDTHARRP